MGTKGDVFDPIFHKEGMEKHLPPLEKAKLHRYQVKLSKIIALLDSKDRLIVDQETSKVVRGLSDQLKAGIWKHVPEQYQEDMNNDVLRLSELAILVTMPLHAAHMQGAPSHDHP